MLPPKRAKTTIQIAQQPLQAADPHSPEATKTDNLRGDHRDATTVLLLARGQFGARVRGTGARTVARPHEPQRAAETQQLTGSDYSELWPPNRRSAATTSGPEGPVAVTRHLPEGTCAEKTSHSEEREA